MTIKVYVASKSVHGPMWQEYRRAWGGVLDVEIISTWIDEWEQGASSSMLDLWARCIHEALNADVLICYVEQGEVLKGALVEIGAALAWRRPVYVCRTGDWTSPDGDRLGSWANHPLVTIAANPDDAIEHFLS